MMPVVGPDQCQMADVDDRKRAHDAPFVHEHDSEREHSRAVAMLQSVLEQLRPPTKDSPPTIARLEALLDHWLKDAGVAAGLTEKLSPKPLSANQKQRLKSELGDAWFFVRNVPAAQRADVCMQPCDSFQQLRVAPR